jgi:hypothetical protein
MQSIGLSTPAAVTDKKITNIKMGVDKVLNMAKTITTIQVQVPNSKEIISKTMIMERHKRIEKLFDNSFWGTQ